LDHPSVSLVQKFKDFVNQLKVCVIGKECQAFQPQAIKDGDLRTLTAVTRSKYFVDWSPQDPSLLSSPKYFFSRNEFAALLETAFDSVVAFDPAQDLVLNLPRQAITGEAAQVLFEYVEAHFKDLTHPSKQQGQHQHQHQSLLANKRILSATMMGLARDAHGFSKVLSLLKKHHPLLLGEALKKTAQLAAFHAPTNREAVHALHRILSHLDAVRFNQCLESLLVSAAKGKSELLLTYAFTFIHDPRAIPLYVRSALGAGLRQSIKTQDMDLIRRFEPFVMDSIPNSLIGDALVLALSLNERLVVSELFRLLEASNKLHEVLKEMLKYRDSAIQTQLLVSRVLPQTFTEFYLFSDVAFSLALVHGARDRDVKLLGWLVSGVRSSKRPHFEARMTVLMDDVESEEIRGGLTRAFEGQVPLFGGPSRGTPFTHGEALPIRP
jgi:hypothetical protein